MSLVRSEASRERTSATTMARPPQIAPRTASARRLAAVRLANCVTSGTSRNDAGAKTNAKPQRAPSQSPIAGISTAARMRSSRVRYALRNISRRVPNRRSVDPLDFVTNLAHRAAELLRDRFDDRHDVVEKKPHDLVTEADRASEAVIVAAVRA